MDSEAIREIRICLPEDLARKAEERDVLRPEVLEDLVSRAKEPLPPHIRDILVEPPPATHEIVISLPEPVAREAEARGVLTSDELVRLIRIETGWIGIKELHDAISKLPEDEFPPMSEQEVQAMIDEMRAERTRARRR